jgi:4-hydroxybenzoate polyprenyltransferase
MLLFVTTVLSIFFFMVFYRSIGALLLYAVYLFLCFAYSGLKIRLKESIAGPFTASFIVWSAGAVIFAVEKAIVTPAMLWYFFGIWLVYTGREIYHTFIDYDSDLLSGYKTFSVRVRLHTQFIAKGVISAAGMISLVVSCCLILGPECSPGLLFLVVFLIVALLFEILFCAGYSGPLYPVLPYLVIRLFIVTFSLLILEIPSGVVVLTLWIFLTSKRP